MYVASDENKSREAATLAIAADLFSIVPVLATVVTPFAALYEFTKELNWLPLVIEPETKEPMYVKVDVPLVCVLPKVDAGREVVFAVVPAVTV